MRTAEEWLDNANGFYYLEDFVYDRESLKKIIIEAQKEAIIECASIGEKNNTYYGCYKDGSRRWITDKKSILSLIDELK